VNDFVKSVDDVATPLFRKDIKQHVDNKYMRLTKRTGIMISVKIKREVLIMPLMILERIVRMKIDIVLDVNINLAN